MAKDFKKKQQQKFNINESPRPNPLKMRPIFSFHNLGKSHCISECVQEEKASFAAKMQLLSQLTWEEIMRAPAHGLGSEVISRKSMKVQIPSCITEDMSIIAIRFYKKAPMVGFRQDNIFHVVWFDRNFEVYPHGS